MAMMSNSSIENRFIQARDEVNYKETMELISKHPELQEFFNNVFHTHQFRHPSNIIIGGSTQSGKTYFLMKILKEQERYWDVEKIDTLHVFYREMQDSYLEMKKLMKERGGKFEMTEAANFPTADEVTKGKDKTKVNVVVIDDMLAKIGDKRNSDAFTDTFIRVSHHQNISIIVILQDVYHQNLKTGRRNSQYFVFLRSTLLMNSVCNILNECLKVRGGETKKKEVKDDILALSLKEQYDHLIVDVHPKTHTDMMFVHNIFGLTTYMK